MESIFILSYLTLEASLGGWALLGENPRVVTLPRES